MSKLFYLTTCAAVLALPAFALAAEQPDAPTPLDQVVVVATRTPEPLVKVGQSVTVLDAPTIKASQAVDVGALLDQTPGVVITRNGGPGQTTSLGIRGATADQTLVLIDGVQLNDPSAPGGGFDFSNLLIGDTSRIEVLRGAHSVLYGSQAIGGVVDVITAEPTRALQGDASAEGGSRDTQYYRAGVGGTVGNLSVRLAGGYYTTSGISTFDHQLGGEERDGFHDAAFSGRLNYDFTPDIQLDLRGYYTQSKTAFDGFSTPTFTFGDDREYGLTTQYIDYTGLNVKLLDGRFRNRIAFQFTDTDRRDFDPDAGPVTETFYGVGRDYRGEYQGTFDIAPGYQAVFGAQHERSTITTDTPAFDFVPTLPLKAHATIDSGYGQLQGEVIPDLTLTGGVRYDAHDQFGDHVTGQASAAYALNNGDTVLRASYGGGFKAPSLYQLFSDFGNPALRPEEADSYDAGIEQRFWDRRATVTATYFARDSRNLIDFANCTAPTAFCASRPFGYYFNVDKAFAQGVELEGSVTPLAGLTLAANYTFTDAENRTSGPLKGDDLARRPENTANASATYLWPFRLSTAVAFRYAGSSFDDAANTTRLKSYTLTDLRLSYPIRDNLELYGRVENLFDKHYETAFQYGSEGRGEFVGVRLKY